MENYSVLMAVYYKENPEYLAQSIKSIMDQTIPTNDFVIVCDGPLTPGLDNVINTWSKLYGNLFQIVKLNENGGLGNALNTGIQYCRNELIARMDSDDISFQNRCEKQLKIFDKYNVDIVSGTVNEFSEDISKVLSSRKLAQTNDKILRFARKRSPFNHPCVMYKKSMVLAAGNYQHFNLFEDYFLWIRMLNFGAKAYNIQEPILYMRAGDNMYSRRGGRAYLKSMIKLRWYMKSIGFSNWSDFFVSVTGQILVCIVPNKIRKYIYKKFLRK